MKALLVVPPFKTTKYGPPIDFCFLSGAIKEKGYEVSIVDINLMINNDSDIKEYSRNFKLKERTTMKEQAYSQLSQYCSNILKECPDIVGIFLDYQTIDYGIKMARILSKFVRCFAYGPKAIYAKKMLENNLFDTVIIDSGEEAIIDVLNGKKGIVSKKLKKGKIYLPDFSDTPIKKYKGFLPVMSSRGCPNRCNFCRHNFEYHTFPEESIVKQINQVNSQEINTLFFSDPNMNYDPMRAKRIFAKVAANGYKYKGHVFGLQIKDDLDLYINEMVEANVQEARVGIESGSLRERISMNKHYFENELIIKFVKKLTENKISVWAQFIFCYPDQTEEDRKKTLNLMYNLNNVCNIDYLKFHWWKFTVFDGRETFFEKEYNVSRSSLQNWENELYLPQDVERLYYNYRSLVPNNTTMWM